MERSIARRLRGSSPHDVLRRATEPFQCRREGVELLSRLSLSIESAMYRDHGWDSFGHVSVIVALEEAYGISIPNDEIMRFTTMRAIVELSERSQAVDQDDR